MSFVRKFLAEKQAGRLRSARSLPPPALAKIEESLLAMGGPAVGPLAECLGHAEAREPALAVLGRLLRDDTLERFLDCLASPNPAIVSGLSGVLAAGRGYAPLRLLPLLKEKTHARPALETILSGQLDRLPVDTLVANVPGAPRDAQVILLRLLEKSCTSGTARALLPLLRDADAYVRTAAVRLLGQARCAEATPGIAALLHDPHKGVKLEAVQALHSMQARGAVKDLVPLLHEPDLRLQTATIDALCALGDAGAVPLLLKVLTDEADTVRRAAVEVLNALATTEAVQDLVRALRDQDWWVRVRAADALGTLGGEVVVRAAAGLLEDDDEALRRHAIEILNAVPSQAAVEALVRALEDSDWWVRERAIDALGKSRDPRALEPLLSQLARGDSTTALCVRALGALGVRDAAPALNEQLKSEREDVRREAAAALHALGSASAGGPGSSSMALPPMVRVGSAAPSPVTPAAAAAPAAQADSGVMLNFADLRPDTVLLGRFRVIRKVGRGGFGAVYLVEDTVVREDLILKILNPQLSLDESAARRFVQELKLTRRITHPNVIRIHDFLELQGSHAVSMEFFAGRDLGQILHEEPVLDYRRGLSILGQVCDGLQAAHAMGVVHRDVKPPNILVGDGGVTKVLDFGLASLQQQIGSRLTRSGLLIGTPEYMAPEQITGESVDCRADLYSLGILMYEMFSGRKPYTAETPVKVLFQHLEGTAEPLASLVPDMPAGIAELAASAMARNAADRPASAAAMRERIDAELRALEEAA